jgi:DNA replication and repair protein RecF
MWIRELETRGFRNLSGRVHFSPGINVLRGRNGQGKTNVIEAIYTSCFPRSFRGGRITDLIRFNEDTAWVRLLVEDDGIQSEIRTIHSPGRRIQGLGGKDNCAPAEVVKRLKVIFFGPDELALVKGGPALRREFIDRALGTHHYPFLELQQRYARVLKERNQLLRDLGSFRKVSIALQEAFEEELAGYGARWVEYRLKYLKELGPVASRILLEHSNGALELQIRYVHSMPDLDESGEWDSRGMSRRLYRILGERRSDDSASGMTSVGPHLDDLEILVNGKSGRHFASQGEQRAVVVALKLAQLSLWKEKFSIAPVLLLDDVSSELDPERNERLFQLISDWQIQTILTTTFPLDVLSRWPEGCLMEVSDGTVQGAVGTDNGKGWQ